MLTEAAPRTEGGPRRAGLGLMVTVMLLIGCSSAPSDRGSGNAQGAVPRVEPILRGGPNKPYALYGRMYFPLTEDVSFREKGQASWYGRDFHGRRTAMGEVFNMHAATAAHRTMPLPSYARVRHLGNGREIIVRVNDRGPFVKDRVIDLSWAAAKALGIQGLAEVEVERLTFQTIRDGQWKTGRWGGAVFDSDPWAVTAAAWVVDGQGGVDEAFDGAFIKKNRPP